MNPNNDIQLSADSRQRSASRCPEDLTHRRDARATMVAASLAMTCTARLPTSALFESKTPHVADPASKIGNGDAVTRLAGIGGKIEKGLRNPQIPMPPAQE